MVIHACPVAAQSIFSIRVNKFQNCQASIESAKIFEVITKRTVYANLSSE